MSDCRFPLVDRVIDRLTASNEGVQLAGRVR